jgi:hypothetical protein
MRRTHFFRLNHLRDNSDPKLPGKLSCLVILLLFFVSTTLASGPPNFATANENPQSVLRNWYNQNYPGVTVEFRSMP